MKKYLFTIALIFYAFLYKPLTCFAQAPQYEDKNGLVVIELENSNYSGNWKKQTTIGSYTGTGYIQWEGAQSFSSTANGQIEIPIKINTPGIYECRIRMAVGNTEFGLTEHNDTWLKIVATNFYAEKNTSKIKPKPECNNNPSFACPEGSSVDGFFKMFGGGATWQWQNKTSDFDDHFVHAEFTTVGNYKIIIAARSSFHALDRIILYNKSITNRTDAEKLTNAETKIGAVVAAPGCTNKTFSAITDFTNIAVAGFSPAYKDNANLCLAINAALYKDQFAAASTLFTGEDAEYDLVLNTLTELDGESTYKVYVDNVKVGEFKNPTTTVDYKPVSVIFPKIEVKKNQTIRVEFNSHTNGKIPEAGGTAYSRGRWTSLEFKCSTVTPPPISGTTVSGELKKWHNIALTFTGPQTNEDASPNPFADYRMEVTFTHSSGNPVFVVPGYFAADGDAANTSAKAGNKWRVHFRPNKTGIWNYKASIKTGANVAINGGGTSASTFDGATGTITIGNSDKTGKDLRANGRLITTNTNYLQYAETGQYFIKHGPDSPESLLDYNDFDFDDIRNDCGVKCYEHNWNGHASDFKTGNPIWKTNKGKNIMGAINYLSDVALVNSFSMTLYGGDDLNVYAWPKANQPGRIDVSKVAQWAIVLDYSEQKGLLAHMKFAEAENSNKLTETQWKIFYREMIARLGHHLGAEFNISEEFGGVSGGGFGSLKDAAIEAAKRGNYFQNVDAYGAHIVLHTGPGTGKGIYDELINLDAKSIKGASMQDSEANSWAVTFTDTKKLTTNSNAKGAYWVVCSDEQNTGGTGVFSNNSMTTNTVSEGARKDVLWGNLMAKGGGVMWYGGSNGDFQTEDYRRHATLDKWSRIAINDFFQKEQIPFWEMSNQDNLISPTANNRCFAKAGSQYVVYLSEGGTTSLNLVGQSGTYDVLWFDPRNGGALKTGTVATINGGGTRSLGNAPNNTSSDWAILVKNKNVITGFEESISLDEVDVFPNPTSNVFYLQNYLEADWSLTDLSGMELMKGNQSRIDISPLPKAVYILKMGNKSERILKE